MSLSYHPFKSGRTRKDIQMKTVYTNEKKDPQIQFYFTGSGAKRWRVKFQYRVDGVPSAIEKQGFKSLSDAVAFKRSQINELESTSVKVLRTMTFNEYRKVFRKQKIATKSWEALYTPTERHNLA